MSHESVAERVIQIVEGAIAYVFVECEERQGTGTGFAYGFDSEGRALVLTNEHVIDHRSPDARHKVAFGDRGLPHDAELLGFHPWVDIALLRVEGAQPSTELRFRDEPARLGEPCVVVGHPWGVGLSLSQGVVSGVDRESLSPNRFPVTMIQTDASVNTGNSGGPMLDRDGQVIGVCSHSPQRSWNEGVYVKEPEGAIVAGVTRQEETPDSLSFFVPSDLAKAAMEAIREGNGEEVPVGEDGIDWSVTELQRDPGVPQWRQRNPILDGALGVLVTGVASGSPAEEAGVAAGDRIVAIDDLPVDHPADLYGWRIKSHSWENESDFSLVRNGETLTMRIKARPAFESTDAKPPDVWRFQA